MIRKPKNVSGLFVLIVLMLFLVLIIALSTSGNIQNLQYHEVADYFENAQVKEFTLDMASGTLEITLDEGVEISEDAQSAVKTDTNQSSLFQLPGTSATTNTQEEKTGTTLVYELPYAQFFADNIEEYVALRDETHPDSPMVYDFIPVTEVPQWISVLPMMLIPIGLLALFYFFMYSQGGGRGAMNVGKAKVKDQSETGRKATFKDVAGADEEKEELAEIVEFLKNQKKFNTLGARIPHGVLLVGPPGTGKTLLARACAGEAGVPFYTISGSDFVEMYVGVGASRVRDLFDKAKKTAPCIIFIDEIDAVGRQRGAGLGGGHDEREQTLNQLLVEMDGFGANEGVIVIAATNRADILDKALLRPGRFDRQVYVGLPDVKGREEILRVHTRNKPLAPDVELKTIAKSTVGFTGADLENLVNEAALMAAKRGKKAITEEDIEESSIKVMAGPEKKSRVVTEKEKKLTAYHEAGHAITHHICETADPVHQISIIPRGMAGGYTMSLPEKDKSYVTKTQMEEQIVTLMGGRVAELLVLDDISTGASNDLERATSIARSMVTRYGFSERLGTVVYGHDENQTFLGRDFSSGRHYSENVAAEIDNEIRAILDAGYERAKRILEEYMEKMHIVSAELLKREKLSGEEFTKLMNGEELPEFEKEEETSVENEKQEESLISSQEFNADITDENGNLNQVADEDAKENVDEMPAESEEEKMQE